HQRPALPPDRRADEDAGRRQRAARARRHPHRRRPRRTDRGGPLVAPKPGRSGRAAGAGPRLPPGEEEQGEDPGVAMISAALWRGRLGRDPAVLGRILHLDGRALRIVGVLPAGYRFPYHADVWLPARVDAASPDDYAVFARLAPGRTLEEARAELKAIAS